MRFLSILLLFASISTFGQINIHLKSGKVITTNYAYLYSSHKSYVKIAEDRKGEKIMINEVDHIEGPDDQGNNRYFKPVNWGNDIWAERGFTSDRVVIYHTDIMVGSMATNHKPKSCLYSKDGGPLTQLKYKHLKKDLSDCAESLEHLKKGKKVARGQTIIYITSYSLILAGFVQTISDADTGSPDSPEASSGPTVSPLLFVGAAGAWIPFLMNDAKNRHFLEALKAYK